MQIAWEERWAFESKRLWVTLFIGFATFTTGYWTIPSGTELYSGVWQESNCTITNRPYPCVVDFLCPGSKKLFHYETLDGAFCFNGAMWRVCYLNAQTDSWMSKYDFTNHAANLEYRFVLSLIVDYACVCAFVLGLTT